MTKIDDGGPVHPTQRLGSDGLPESSMDCGISIRDYFASAAMQGMCAFHGSYGSTNGPGDIADRAFHIADEMISARSKPTGEV